MTYWIDLMKLVRIHKSVAREIKKLDSSTRVRVATMFGLLASGESMGMPLSRPMPSITNGAHELRIKDERGQYRIFYYTKMNNVLIVFHFFKKKTRATPKKELNVALERLGSML